MKQSLYFLLFLFPIFCVAQAPVPPASTAEERLASFEQRKKLIQSSQFNELQFTSVGPTVFGGRIVDLAVNPKDPSIFYAAYASGGLWFTENNGITFTPIFDHEAVMTIGDIAVDWELNHIWIGTGENNSSRSSYAGLGIYKSEDGGKTWKNRGLLDSHHIGRIILHPTDPNILWVAALGHLYSDNQERGIYKSTDGGITWSNTLFINPKAGAIDLIIDPQDENTLYAAFWERERSAWNFVESGLGSGIHKSTDGGTTWSKISGGKSGFPSTAGTGRIGLTASVENGKTIVYAVLDNYDRRPAEEKKKDKEGLVKGDFENMSSADFAIINNEDLDKFLKKNNFPKKYSSKKVKQLVQKGTMKPVALKEYLEDANSLLFDTPVIGAELYRSEDGGSKWSKTHDGYLDDLFYSYGYYFAQVRANPSNANELYIFGVPVLRSDDGGKNFKSINGDNVHADHHACWINPDRQGHVIIGNDGGVNISYDAGENWIKCNSPAVGQFYSVEVDNATPYNIYGGLQDNGVWYGPSNYEASTRWQASGKYPYESIMGGDGMQVKIDSRDNTTVYTGFQFGNYYRGNVKTGDVEYITPKHELGDRPLRWNWQTPIHLSIHNQDIFYMGSNKFHRSFNQGEDFDAISEDLTTGGIKGDVAYSTLTSIHESPKHFGLLYAGSDDGLVHCSKDGGNSWEKCNEGLPERMWITRVQASNHAKSRVYLSMNGYRWDDFKAYVFVSENYGKTWRSIVGNLPHEPINLVEEDSTNPDILYVGTDNGLYVSLDRGSSWQILKGNLPAAPVHDIAIHEGTEDLIVGTHGRSFWKGSVKEIRQLSDEVLSTDLSLLKINNKRRAGNWGKSWSKWRDINIPEMIFPVYSKTSRNVEFTVKDEVGNILSKWNADLKAGVNYVNYNLETTKAQIDRLNKELEEKDQVKEVDNEKWYLPKGKYILEAVGASDSTKFELE